MITANLTPTPELAPTLYAPAPSLIPGYKKATRAITQQLREHANQLGNNGEGFEEIAYEIEYLPLSYTLVGDSIGYPTLIRRQSVLGTLEGYTLLSREQSLKLGDKWSLLETHGGLPQKLAAETLLPRELRTVYGGHYAIGFACDKSKDFIPYLAGISQNNPEVTYANLKYVEHHVDLLTYELNLMLN